MTISELQILLNLNKGNECALLEEHASWTKYGYFFVDLIDGQCWLFDKNGNLDDNKKITTLHEIYVKKDIKKIIIPNGVKSIGSWAFNSCMSLACVEIPESVGSIGNYAFWNCTSLTNIEIPNGVESIKDHTFARCKSLTSIEIPNSVKSIGYNAFFNCTSLKSIEIPENLKSIGKWAFEDCMSLTSIVFKGKTMDQIKVMDGYPWGIKDETVIKCQKS